MAAFEYTLPAVRGMQAGREYYVAMCPLQLVPRLFQVEEDELQPELRAQRVLNKGRVPEIARYLAGHPRSYVLSSLTASIDREVAFEAIPSATGMPIPGHVTVPLAARLLLHDGLH